MKFDPEMKRGAIISGLILIISLLFSWIPKQPIISNNVDIESFRSIFLGLMLAWVGYEFASMQNKKKKGD